MRDMKALFILFVIMLWTILALNELNAAETRIKIAVIDSGIGQSQVNKEYVCENGVKTFISNDSGIDGHGHGTNIIGLIANRINAKTHCIVSYKVISGADGDIGYTVKSLLDISNDKSVKYLNVSMSGKGNDMDEMAGYLKVLNNGVIVNVAAGNDRENLDMKCIFYPACYANEFKHPNFNVIGSSTGEYGNVGRIVTAYVDGTKKGYPVLTGTSQSTAIYTGKIISKN